MHLVTLLGGPALTDESLRTLAAVLELSPYEARTRTNGDPPRLLAALADLTRANELVRELGAHGFAATALDASTIEHDEDRDIATSLAFEPSHLRVTLRNGTERDVPWDCISLVLQGVRTATSTTVEERTTKKFDAGRTLLTGGLVMRKATTTTDTKTTEAREAFLYLYEAGVRPAIALYERRTNWSFLGAKLNPSAAANFATAVAEIKQHAPHTRFDARLQRPVAIGAIPLPPRGLDAAVWKIDVAAALLSLTA